MREGDVEHYGIGAVLIAVMLIMFVGLGASLPATASSTTSAPSRESVSTPDPPPDDWAQQGLLRAAEQWQAEAEQAAAEQAETERLAAEQAEAERLAAEQAEAERVAAEQQVAALMQQQPAPVPAPVVAQPTYQPTSSGAWGWEPVVRQAMGALGIPEHYLPGIIGQLNSESGGDQYAYNGWDSNAAAGIPSQGLMQVIPPTFAAYTAPGCTDIYDPYCNIYAGLNWAVNRYGYSRFDLWSQGIHYGY